MFVMVLVMETIKNPKTVIVIYFFIFSAGHKPISVIPGVGYVVPGSPVSLQSLASTLIKHIFVK